jgi:hypothetical protein
MVRAPSENLHAMEKKYSQNRIHNVLVDNVGETAKHKLIQNEYKSGGDAEDFGETL